MRVYKLKKKGKRIYGLRFTPDSRQLLVVHGNKDSIKPNVATWLDLAKGVQTQTVSFYTDIYRGEAFAISSDHSRLVISNRVDHVSNLGNLIHWCNPRETPVQWHARDLEINWSPETRSIRPFAIALTSDGNRMLAASEWQLSTPESGYEGTVFSLTEHRFDTQTGSKHLTVDSHFNSQNYHSQIKSLAFAPDSKHWAAGYGKHWMESQGDGRRPNIDLFDQFGSEPLHSIELKGTRIDYLTFSPDGRYLAAIAARTVIVLDANRLTTVSILGSQSKQVNGIAFAPDSGKLLTVTNDGTVRVWDSTRAEIIQTFDWNIGPLTAVAFSPDGTLCAAGGKEGQIVLWDVD
ncbi:MAG TPA: hypothetical protein VG097_12755 [Gemmata sp.]|nr:hypothetical protein [Gemmata sp.]